MNEENLREKLEIDTKLELMKEHKCCAESILCIEMYMHCLEQEKQQLKEQELNHKQLKDLEMAHLLNSCQTEKLTKLEEQLKQRDEVIDEVIEWTEKFYLEGKEKIMANGVMDIFLNYLQVMIII